MAAAKPTLREWVLGLADRGDLGVEWLDPERTAFSVPWGKGSTVQAFVKSWALTFGKHAGSEDFAKWKHGLRCALDSQFTHRSEGIDRPQRRVYSHGRPPKSKAGSTQPRTSPLSQPQSQQTSPLSQSQTSPPLSQCQASPFSQPQTSPLSQYQASPSQPQTSPLSQYQASASQPQTSPLSQYQASPSQPQTNPLSQYQASPFSQPQTSPLSQYQASPFSQPQTSAPLCESRMNDLSASLSAQRLYECPRDGFNDLEDLTPDFLSNLHLPVQETGDDLTAGHFGFSELAGALNATGPVACGENRQQASEVAEPEMFILATELIHEVPHYSVSDLDLTVLYRGSQVLSKEVTTSRCVICHEPPHSAVASPQPDVTVVALPPPVGGAEQRRLTALILEPLARTTSAEAGGVVLDTDRRGVHATRHTLSRVFWSLHGGAEHGAAPAKLPRGERVCLFSMETFSRELRVFLKSPRPQPSFQILLCFGQAWPLGKAEEKLIMVKVVPTCARIMVELARQLGASSFDGSTVRLQISDPLSNEMMDVDDLDNLLDWIGEDGGRSHF